MVCDFAELFPNLVVLERAATDLLVVACWWAGAEIGSLEARLRVWLTLAFFDCEFTDLDADKLECIVVVPLVGCVPAAAVFFPVFLPKTLAVGVGDT